MATLVFPVFFLENMMTALSAKMAQLGSHSVAVCRLPDASPRTGTPHIQRPRWTIQPLPSQQHKLSLFDKLSSAVLLTSSPVRAGVRPFPRDIPAAYPNRGVVPFSSVQVSWDRFNRLQSEPTFTQQWAVSFTNVNSNIIISSCVFPGIIWM